MIRLENVSKAFKDNLVLNDISMEIRDNELTVLIGPSGCGKTTTLKLLNRLLSPTKGHIYIDDTDIKTIDKVYLRRNMGYVIQKGGLFPHLTNRQNIEIIPRIEGKPVEEIEKRTVRFMEMVNMDPDKFLDRYPTELSGGEQQRIGVIRALANDPNIILFDEPFSALDPITRISLQEELIDLQRKVGKTMIFVTHDMDEAMKIADRVCIMNGGKILQFDTPDQIMKNPANEFVAEFVGANRIWDSPEYILVSDFMISSPVTCSGSLTARNCVDRMREHHVDTLLVVDDEGRLEGIIGRKALFRNKDPMTKASDIMFKPEYTANPDDSIVDVLRMIDETEVNNVPVVNDYGRLEGLLTSSNLVSTLSRRFIDDGEDKYMESEVRK